MRRLVPVLFSLLLGLTGPACREDGTITVRSITFTGVHSVDPSALKAALATREDSKIPLVGWRIPWARHRNYFDRSRFDADLKRIEAFYADRGFPDARVTSFDVHLNDKQDAVAVTLTIAEGEPVRVAAIELKGFEVVPEGHLALIRKQLPLEVGQPRDRQKVVAAREMALNELRDHGYPYSRVLAEEDDGPRGKEARIVFTAEPGTLAHFGDVEIVGQKSVSESVIRRQVTFKAGDLYRRSAIQETQRRLYALELFQFVNLESLEMERQSPEVRTRLTVAEGRHQRVNGGIGYGTEEKVRLDGEYKHFNFLGGARTAGAHARWSGFDKGVRLDFVQPYFLLPGFTLGLDAQRWSTDTPAYNSTVTGARVAYTFRPNARTSASVSLSSERNFSEVKWDPLESTCRHASLSIL